MVEHWQLRVHTYAETRWQQVQRLNGSVLTNGVDFDLTTLYIGARLINANIISRHERTNKWRS